MNRKLKAILATILLSLITCLLIVFVSRFEVFNSSLRKINRTYDEYERDCMEKGGIVTTTDELDYVSLHDPPRICAFVNDDADKECYDNNDCVGACILGGHLGEYSDHRMGKCQKYKNGGLNGKTERLEGVIKRHSLITE